ncbi:fungal-specific transcription factor domain-containing protein [Xylariales sp. PMI_506]|nr:fungal-specific transcription factor domain-containing protein [Xylariales sp. PMI_506]
MVSRVCWTCRYRGVRCDGGKPTCSTCNIIGFPCSGYYNSSTAADAGHGAAEGDKRGLLLRLNPTTALDAAGSFTASIANDPVPPLYNEAQLIFDGIHYYNEVVSVTLLCTETQFNPYKIQLIGVEQIPRCLCFKRIYINLLVSTATLHRSMQGDEASPLSSSLIKREHDLFNFRIRALQDINHRLSDRNMQTTDSTLMCVLCLLLSTMQQSAYSDWRVHLEGARRIIQLRGGLKKIVEQNKYFKPLLAFFIIIDVMAATTVASTHKYMYTATTMALHYWEIEPGIFKSNLAISAPCPEELFQVLILANYLRAISNKPSLASRRRVGTCMILSKVQAFSAPEWARRMRGFKGWSAEGDTIEIDETTAASTTSNPTAKYPMGPPPLPTSSPLFAAKQPGTPVTPIKREYESSNSSSSPPDIRWEEQGADSDYLLSIPFDSSEIPSYKFWLSLAVTYRAAILLYAIRTLILDLPEDDRSYLDASFTPPPPGGGGPSSSSSSSLHTPPPTAMDAILALRRSARRVLAAALRPMFSSPEAASRLGKLVYFPMLVCGMESEQADAEADAKLRAFIAGGFDTVGYACGTLGPISAAAELRAYWDVCAERARLDPKTGGKVTWDEYFGSRPDFIFGF